jgi:hypothetical protein
MLVNAHNPWDPSAAVNVRLKFDGDVYVKGKRKPLDGPLTLASGEGVFVVVD